MCISQLMLFADGFSLANVKIKLTMTSLTVPNAMNWDLFLKPKYLRVVDISKLRVYI